MRGRDVDALPALSFVIVALFGIPSALIVKPLGAAGTPADVIAMLLLLWWGFARLTSPETMRSSTPVHAVLGVFAAAMVLTYAHGMLRPITGAETTSADRGLLTLLAWCGLTLAVADGLLSRVTLDAFLRRLVVGGGAVAALGIYQFFTGFDVATVLHIPGLTVNHPFGEAGERSAFRRITATTQHPIEFGIVMSLLLPIALHFAMYATEKRQRRWARLSAGLILVALPMTVARSAMVGLAVVLVMLFFSWTPRQQGYALIVAPIAAVGVKFAVPGLLGTIRQLFLHAGQDPSIVNRLGDYSASGLYIVHNPWLGRGFFTFLPNMYRTLDNQYMGTLIEGGVVGLVALMSVMIGGATVGVRIRRRSRDLATRSLAFSLATSMVAAFITFFTFDALSFPMVTSVLFILLGALGALRHLVPPRVPAPVYRSRSWISRWNDLWKSRRAQRASRGVLAAAMLVIVVAALAMFGRTQPSYGVTGSILLTGGAGTPAAVANPYAGGGRYLGDFPALLARSLTSEPQRAALRAQGYTANYEIAIGSGSLEPGTDVIGTGDVVQIHADASRPEQALGTFNVVVTQFKSRLSEWQEQYKVAPGALIRIQTSFLPTFASVEPPSTHRAQAATLALMLGLWFVIDARLRRRRSLWLAPESRAGGVASESSREPALRGPSR